MKRTLGAGIAGFGAGTLTGLFGAGGGMVLVPTLSLLTDLKEDQMFATSVSVLLPICVVSLLFTKGWETFSFTAALPYLLGSLLGGIIAGIWGKKIPSLWLHRVLGILIVWGGIRYIWQVF